MTSRERDIPGVIAPPPLLALAVIVLGLFLDWLLPLHLLTLFLSLSARLVIGLPLIGVGLAMMIVGRSTFQRVGTNVPPWEPALLLVTDGIFGWLRNPMYVGGILALAGLAIALGSNWMLVMVVIASLVIHFGVVLREERYLERKFGDDYRRFKASVPRYGWPF